MLPTERLGKAIEKSDNPLLQALWAAVLHYNRMGSVALKTAKFETMAGNNARAAALRSQVTEMTHPKAMALQDVMIKAGVYLTSKPPQRRKRENTERWNAIRNLAEAAGREAEALQIKLVNSPTDMRKVGGDSASVWLEVIDPMHRDMGYLSIEYAKWLVDANAIKNKTSFWQYRGAVVPERDKWWSYDRVLYDALARSAVEFGPGGIMVDSHDEPVDTTNGESFHTGRGWGIFAYDTKQRFFVSDHHGPGEEWIRHTTLAAGAPVKAAGEIVVYNGRIRGISNETGHYRLPHTLFLQFLCGFSNVPNNAIAKVVGQLNGQPFAKFATCQEIRAAGGVFEKINFRDWEARFTFRDVLEATA